MSEFGTKFTSQGIVKLLDRLGDSVSYKAAATGVSVTRNAVFNPQEAAGYEARGVFTMASDAATGIASPSRGDKITYAGDTWTVVALERDQIGAWLLTCSLPEAVS